ncbi:hypothetical protein COV17_01535 [Candidatus Woesearchaeota archaeon CG10_big_fil_rev_8_21_14_0_10_36_11]|nr:MAG: hypothetical protein COV17_01535 [Candidatus Woesearchaeota archaeon CG10_big_fil_rev_8_21_14_0_10_36_11]
MITLIVGGIFILLLVNNNESAFGFTSAVIGNVKNTTADQGGVILGSERSLFGETFENNELLSAKKVSTRLTFNTIPSVAKDARVNNMELRFDDLSTTITVNEDKLELHNLKEVYLRIENFVGRIGFEGGGASLKGTASRIAVNDVALSSEKNIDIEFNNLDYKYLNLDSIELRDISLSRGSGKLEVGERLAYSLENDKITIGSFKGEFTVDKTDNSTEVLTLEGDVQGISVSGDLLDLDVR